MKTVENKLAFSIVLLGLAAIVLSGCGGKGVSPPSHANIGVSEDTLNYDSTRMQQELVIYNTGGDVLTWSFPSWPAWVQPSVSSGTIDGYGQQVATLSIIRSWLSPGLNLGILPLYSSDDSVQIILVAMQSSQAVLARLPDSLEFGTSLDSLLLTILNAGRDTLHWGVTLSQTGSAFDATPVSGSTLNQNTVWVRFHRNELDPGSYHASLQVNSDGGNGQVILSGYVGGSGGYWLSYSQQSTLYYPPNPMDLYFIVRFDRPAGWQSFKISAVRVNLYTLTGAFDDVQLFCWGVVYNQGFLFPDVDHTLHQSPIFDPISGWNEWLVNWPLALSTFTVGYYQYDPTSPAYPAPWYDATTVAARSYRVFQDLYGHIYADLISDRDWCLEIFVEPIYTTTVTPQQPQGVWLKSSKVLAAPFSSTVNSLYRARIKIN